ncbi:hypothetical protein N0V84_006658 [Fusarium piperis]|uniref:Uncharacterized protein n=1 Tax=Fusarium piperis TaxID=1435070 RepID=A0A9W8WBL6_9HYPO|nr:hypothetical protein N0V84_006658 [Fusarium piperis]
MTDVLGLTTVVTLYQAGNGIYEHFHKVLVLDAGKQIFCGSQRDTVPFMEGLSFMRGSGSNRADFSTGVTVPTQRLIAPGNEDTFPRTADEVLAAYDRSLVKPSMLDECRSYPAREEAAVFREMVAREKHRGVPKKSPVTADFLTQVKTAVIDGFNCGEKTELYWSIRTYELAIEEKVKFYVDSSLAYAYKRCGYDPKFRGGHYDAKGRIGEWILSQNSYVSEHHGTQAAFLWERVQPENIGLVLKLHEDRREGYLWSTPHK